MKRQYVKQEYIDENPWVAPKPPSGHRLMKFGEVIKENTLIKYGDDWINITSISIGDTVKKYLGYATPIIA